MGTQRNTPPRRSNRSGGTSLNHSRSGCGGQGIVDNSSRTVWVLLAFAVVAVIFICRLVFLQVVVAEEYSQSAQESRTANIETSPRRGTIYDRNGNVLATSVDATTIYVNPSEVSDASAEAAQLASVLGGEVKTYQDKLESENTKFAYVKRKAEVAVAEQVKALDLDGIYFLPDTKRVYPYKQVGGQVIGFVGLDDEGMSGLEYQYEDILRGTPGTLVVERGSGGIPIPGGVKEETKAINGEDIIISLDIGLQEYLEARLVQGVKDLNSPSGNSIVLDAGTGEIYACASLPLYDPSNTSTIEDATATQAKSITTAFEPGSIFKTVSTLAILEANTMTPDSELFCPAVIEANGYKVTDAHDRYDETMTLRQILDNSSNIGISLATQKMGSVPLYDKIIKYNLNEATGIDYPYEPSGNLTNVSTWSQIQAWNVSFGQGVAVSPLQITRFYGALVNDGVECTPHFLMEKPLSGETPTYPSEDVIDNKTAIPTMNNMLETVVTEGTGKGAQIEGYRVAGKTSTAEIADPEGGYKSGVYNLCFTGFLPESTSQLVCFVGADEVPGDGTVTAMFKDIMAYAIDRYKIMPS